MDKRTTFITAAAVTGVFLAGAAAVGANIGILNAADNGGVGELNPLAVVTTTQTTEPVATSIEPQVIDVYVEEPAVTAAPGTVATEGATPGASTQQFAVDVAGTVEVEQTATGVLLDGVDVADGWTWAAGQAADGELVVTFTSTDAEFVFYASLADDGTISARVDQPIINIVQVPGAPRSTQPQVSASAGTSPSVTVHDDDDDDYDYDDDDDDHDDRDDDHDDDDDHDGGDDDD